MNKETFIKILQLQSEHYKKEQQLYELGVELINLNESIVGAVEMLWSEVLTEEGFDWLSWFMYDKYWISGDPREDIQAFDENKNEIVKTVDELYDYLVSNSYFRAVKDLKQSSKNKISKEIKDMCHCGRLERENGEHYCKSCLNENPLLCT